MVKTLGKYGKTRSCLPLNVLDQSLLFSICTEFHKTLGEGTFGKYDARSTYQPFIPNNHLFQQLNIRVKYGINTETNGAVAIKVLDKVLSLFSLYDYYSPIYLMLQQNRISYGKTI